MVIKNLRNIFNFNCAYKAVIANSHDQTLRHSYQHLCGMFSLNDQHLDKYKFDKSR